MNFELSASEKTLLETIRRYNNSNKSLLVEKSNLPWSTVSSSLTSLTKKGWIESGNGNRETVRIANNLVHFLGVSVGTGNIKIVLTNILCEPISKTDNPFENIHNNISNRFEKLAEFKDYYVNLDTINLMWCFRTPSNFIVLSDLLSHICDIILEECTEIKIASICFVFPGVIDFVNQKIIVSNYSNQSIEATNIRDILSINTLKKIDHRNIMLCIEHNVKASTMYEFSCFNKLNFSSSNNFSAIYLGFGIGIGSVINGALVRGAENKAGQFGYIRVPIFSDNYISKFYTDNVHNFKSDDYIISSDSEQNNVKGYGTLEKVLRNQVFYPAIKENKGLNDDNDNTLKEAYKSTPLDDLLAYINHKEIYKYKLAFYLGFAISDYIKICSIDTIVFCGKLAKLFEIIRMELKWTIMKFHCDVNMMSSKNGEFSAALGAAEIAYRKKFEIFDE